MLIADLIQNNLGRLVAAYQGRRVGVYPADHGRFADDLSLRLAGLDPVGIHHDKPGFRDQGLQVFEDREDFLDAVDVVLMWGLDAYAGELLYAALARKNPPECINVLDPASPYDLLSPRSELVFADFREPSARDQAILDASGLGDAYLRQAFERDDDSERAFAAELGVAGRTDQLDGRFDAFEISLLECGTAFCPCPVCGRPLASDQAFLVRQQELHFVTFHRFVCHEEFYLFKTTPIIVGLYLPGRELFINALPRGMDMRYMFFEEPHLRSLIRRFKLLCLRRLDAVRKYARPRPKKPLLLCGAHINFGHHVRNELAGVQALLDAGMTRALSDVYITLNDIFEVEKLLPELPAPRKMGTGDLDRQAFEAFSTVLDEGRLPILIHYGGDFQESLAQKLMAMAKQRCRPFALDLAGAIRRHAPVIWITLRTTRAWISQNAGFIEILRRLYARFPGMVVVFDGFEEERARMRTIAAGLPADLPWYDGLCLNRFETIHLIRHIDVHISPLGSGATFLGIVNKPGVFHCGEAIGKIYLLPAGEGSVASLPRENAALNLAVTAVEEDATVEPTVRHYELDVDELFEAILTVLSRSEFGRTATEMMAMNKTPCANLNRDAGAAMPPARDR